MDYKIPYKDLLGTLNQINIELQQIKELRLKEARPHTFYNDNRFKPKRVFYDVNADFPSTMNASKYWQKKDHQAAVDMRLTRGRREEDLFISRDQAHQLHEEAKEKADASLVLKERKAEADQA